MGDEVDKLSQATARRKLLLRHTGLEDLDDSPQRAPKDSWGFTRGLPNLIGGSKATSTETYLEGLQRSSTFACPDSIAAMLRAYGLPAGILQGSVLRLDHGKEKEEVLQNARARLKSDIQLEWSQEAVERGVVHSKDGEFSAACRCYKQALEICPKNADALVAMGAAHANQRSFQNAIGYFNEALAMRPEDANALKYKKAVEQRLEAVAHLVGGSDVGLACGTATMSAAHGETPRGTLFTALDVTGGAAAQQQPLIIPNEATIPNSLAMDTQEAMRIVSTHYERKALAISPPYWLFAAVCMDGVFWRLFMLGSRICLYDAFLLLFVQALELGSLLGFSGEKEKEEGEEEVTQTSEETQEHLGIHLN